MPKCHGTEVLKPIVCRPKEIQKFGADFCSVPDQNQNLLSTLVPFLSFVPELLVLFRHGTETEQNFCAKALSVSLYLPCYEVKLGYTARQSFLSDRIIVFARRWSVRCLRPSGTVTHCLRWPSPARYGLARRPGAGARRGVEEEH